LIKIFFNTGNPAAKIKEKISDLIVVESRSNV